MAERLQKYLARAGVASRRHAEELITAGKIQVNNRTVTELGTKVEPGQDLVTVEGRLVSPPDTNAYFILYKPVGVVTTLEDPQGRPTVAPLAIEPGRRLFPIGRLDYDAEGALLLTDDGELAHQLMHPKFQVPRTYLVKVKGVPTEGTLEKLRAGVRLEDGVAQPKQVEVYERAEKNTWLMIVVAEGRPHLIKRLCAAIGHPVVRLYRPNYAGVSVEGLRPGDKRPLSQAEIEKLRNSGGGQDTPPERAKSLKLPPRRHGRAGEQEGVSFDEEEVAPKKAAPKKPRAKTSAGTGTFRGAANRPDEGAADADEAGGFIRKPRSETKGPGRPDNNEGGGYEERPARPERPARAGGFGDRPERPARAGGKFGDRAERPARAGGFGDRAERPARAGGKFGDRAERPARAGGKFGDRPERPARAGGKFGDRAERPARAGGFGDRAERPARGGFGDRPARAGGKFGDRAGAGGKFGDRPARAGGKFGDRAGAGGKFGDRPARAGGKFGDRPPRGDRPERAGGFGDRPPRGDRPERAGGFGDRPSRGPAAERAPREERAPRGTPEGVEGLRAGGPGRGGIFKRGGGYQPARGAAGADRGPRRSGEGRGPSKGHRAPGEDRGSRPPPRGGGAKTKRWNPSGEGGGSKE